jgi:hypothetical protein
MKNRSSERFFGLSDERFFMTSSTRLSPTLSVPACFDGYSPLPEIRQKLL